MITLNTKKILIPIDFSETSLRAIKHGAFIAKKSGGELLLLHVQKRNDLMDVILPALDMNEKDMGAITKFLEAKLEKLAEGTRKGYGIPVSALVSVGHITSEIVDMAEEHGVGMIVMGTQGSDSDNDLFLGSNSYRVLTKSDIPVMTVRSDAMQSGYSKILLPVDTSVHSRQKVMAALGIANKFASHVHVLGIIGKYEDNHEFKLKVILPQIQKLAEERGLAFSGEILKADDRAKDTLECAARVKADLIICMRDENYDFPKWLLSTYAHAVLNESKIPVICIPPEEHPENFGQDSIGGMW